MARPYPPSPFSRFAKATAHATGHPVAFMTAVSVVAGWAITGPLFGFSDTWQLVINTGTTIVTFLMVFLIQNTQNRESAAVQLKLDELIRSVEGAHNRCWTWKSSARMISGECGRDMSSWPRPRPRI